MRYFLDKRISSTYIIADDDSDPKKLADGIPGGFLKGDFGCPGTGMLFAELPKICTFAL